MALQITISQSLIKECASSGRRALYASHTLQEWFSTYVQDVFINFPCGWSSWVWDLARAPYTATSFNNVYTYVNTRTGVSSAWAVLWKVTFVFTGILQTSCFYTLWMAIITPFSKWLFMIKGSLFWNTREAVFRSPILSVVYNKVYVYLEIWESFIPWKFPTIPLRQWNRNPVHITESVKFQKLKYMVVY